MTQTLSPQVAPQVVILTTCGASSDDKVYITTLGFSDIAAPTCDGAGDTPSSECWSILHTTGWHPSHRWPVPGSTWMLSGVVFTGMDWKQEETLKFVAAPLQCTHHSWANIPHIIQSVSWESITRIDKTLAGTTGEPLETTLAANKPPG